MRSAAVWLWIGLLFGADAMAQHTPYAFRVRFTDKNGSIHRDSLGTYFSPRAMERRAARGSLMTETDRPVPADYVDSVLAFSGGKLHLVSRWFNQCVVLAADSAGMNELRNTDFVDDVRLVGYYPAGLHLTPEKQPEDVERTPGSLMRITADSSLYGHAAAQSFMVNGHVLHEQGWKGEGMLIAVVDAGFRGVDLLPGFQDLIAAGRIEDTYDFVLATDNVFAGDVHGTGVLSPLAGNIPDMYLGTAPDAAYALYRSENDYSEQEVELDQLVAALERADSTGADIVNISLGYDVFTFPPGMVIRPSEMDGRTTLPARAVNIAAEKGILVLASAGNEGAAGLLTPGDADSALTVGAVNAGRAPASFSGRGPNAGGNIKPEVCAMGNPAMIFHVAGIGGANGTSYAVPQISGWAACLWQAAPAALPSDIRNAIIRSADHYDNPGRQIGYGIPDFRKAAAALKVIDTSVDQATPGNGLFSVWPTLLSGVPLIRVRTDLRDVAQVSLQLTDVSGRTLWQSAMQVQAGIQYGEITLPDYLAGGVYLLRLSAGNAMHVVKIVRQ